VNVCASKWTVELININGDKSYPDSNFCLTPSEAGAFFAIAGRWQ